MHLIVVCAALAVLAQSGPIAVPGPAEPAPVEAASSTSPATVPPPSADPGPLFPRLSARLSVAGGSSRELAAEAFTTALTAALVLRAGHLLLGGELGTRLFVPGGSDNRSVNGYSLAFLAGSGLAVGEGLRVTALGELGWQTYQLQAGVVEDVSGGSGALPFAGARLGLELRGRRAMVGLAASYRETLGSAREPFTQTVCAFGCTSEQRVARYGGGTIGLELVLWVNLDGAGTAP